MAQGNGIIEVIEPKAERMFELNDRTALIVGGGGKMGIQFGHTLALAGANVILVDKDSERCSKNAREISQAIGKPVERRHLDSRDDAEVQELFQSLYSTHGRIDILIYNVMTKPDGYYKSTDDYTLETWDGAIAGNLTGAFLCCREAAKFMKPARSGAIVLTSSIYGVVAPDHRLYSDCVAGSNIYDTGESLNCPAVYSASKAGLIGLTRYLATQWGRYDIRVNALTPGGVYDGQEEAFRREYVERTPLGRMATWSDFNGALLFMVSDASRYMTGHNLIVDGGWTAW